MRGKKIWGRKRHLLVDTQGHLLAIKVTGAHQSDRTLSQDLALANQRALSQDQAALGRQPLWWHVDRMAQGPPGLDHGHSAAFEGTRTRSARAAISPEVEWEQLFPSGFRPLPRRWVVERSFAWITRWRRLARDHEGRPESSEAFIKLSACRRMVSLLAPPFP